MIRAKLLVLFVCFGLSLCAEGQARTSPKEILKSAISRESPLFRGTATVTVEQHSGSGLTDLGYGPILIRETEMPLTISLDWNVPAKFQIVLSRDGKTIRKLVSDGEKVDTGDGRVWSIDFLTGGFFDNESERAEALEDEFYDLIWPLRLIVRTHMLPMTKGGPVPFEIYEMTNIIRYSPAQEPGDENQVRLRLKYQLDSSLYDDLSFDVGKGFALTESRAHYDSKLFDHRLYSDYRKTPDGFWIPHRLEIYGNDSENLVISSTLEKIDLPSEDAEAQAQFKIDDIRTKTYVPSPDEGFGAKIRELGEWIKSLF